MPADLVALASRYVELSAQLEQTRIAMRLALANGAAGETEASFFGSSGGSAAARPTQAPRRGRHKPQSPLMQTQAATADQAEQEIVAYLQLNPNAQTRAVVEATKAKRGTAMARLRRLRAQGKISGGGEAGWTAAAP
jgi:hypothetical protein